MTEPSPSGKETSYVSDTEHLIETGATDAPVKDIHWESNQLATASETHLEDDTGHGDPVIIRVFEFSANLEVFKHNPPSKQDLLNAHLRGIEVMLWQDGLKVYDEVPPRVILGKTKYRIIVPAKAARGHLFSYRDQPKTLSDIAHNR